MIRISSGLYSKIILILYIRIFFRNLHKKYPNLTPSDLRFCSVKFLCTTIQWKAHYTNLGALELKLLVVVAFFQHQQSQQVIQTNFVSFDIDDLAEYLRIERNNFPYLRQRIRNIQSAFISYENEQEQWEQDIPLFEPPKYHYHRDGEKQFYRVDFQIHEKLLPTFLTQVKKVNH